MAGTTATMSEHGPEPPDAPDAQGPRPGRARYERRFVSGDHETRAVLAEVCARLAAAGLDDDAIGTVELVLAEVLNNITEHAYGVEGGPVALGVDLPGDAVICEVVDQGRPMPMGRVPEPGLPRIAPPDDLPEGGFGWHIVRCLVSDLGYERRADGNRLHLRVPLAADD